MIADGQCSDSARGSECGPLCHLESICDRNETYCVTRQGDVISGDTPLQENAIIWPSTYFLANLDSYLVVLQIKTISCVLRGEGSRIMGVPKVTMELRYHEVYPSMGPCGRAEVRAIIDTFWAPHNCCPFRSSAELHYWIRF